MINEISNWNLRDYIRAATVSKSNAEHDIKFGDREEREDAEPILRKRSSGLERAHRLINSNKKKAWRKHLETEIRNRLREEQLDENRDYNINFKTGDRVYRDGEKIGSYPGGGHMYKPQYGTVVKHSNTTAKVQWADGSHTVHNHYGRERGDNSTYLSHRYNKSTRINHKPYEYKDEQEHIDAISNKADDAQKTREHINRHSALINDLHGHHHSDFTPEHLDALDKINNEIKSKHKINEERLDEEQKNKNGWKNYIKITAPNGQKDWVHKDSSAAKKYKKNKKTKKLDEISNKTLANYVKGAGSDLRIKEYQTGSLADYQDRWSKAAKAKLFKKIQQRSGNMNKAVDRLVGEEQLDEISNKTLKSYVRKSMTSRNRLWDKADKEEDKAMSTDGTKYPEKQNRHQKNANDAIRKWRNRGDGLRRANKGIALNKLRNPKQ